MSGEQNIVSSERGYIVVPKGSYRDLLVWQKAMDLAELVYEATRLLPREELYGLQSQSRRSVVSIAANIAEGHGRETGGAFVQFLRNARGSLKELETHILLCGRLGLLEPEIVTEILKLSDEVGRMLHGLIMSIQNKTMKGS